MVRDGCASEEIGIEVEVEAAVVLRQRRAVVHRGMRLVIQSGALALAARFPDAVETGLA